MSPDKKTVATITNGAYLLVGAQLFVEALYVPAVFTCLLGAGSGAHHFFQTSFTRKLDFYGMFSTSIALLSLLVPISTGYGLAGVGAGSYVLVLLFGPHRIILGVLMGLVLAGVFLKGGIGSGMEVLAFISVAYGFNFIGDNLHVQYHSLIHGLWHITSSYSILLAASAIVV